MGRAYICDAGGTKETKGHIMQNLAALGSDMDGFSYQSFFIPEYRSSTSSVCIGQTGQNIGIL